MKIIETSRLILRLWKDSDAESYFAIHQDQKVIEFLPASLSMKQVSDFIPAANKHHKQYGYSLWAAELKDTSELIGFIGLNYADFETNFTPTVEIGWRLGSKFWGQGYATEGAKASLDYGFNKIGLEEIVSFTVPDNQRSINVMEKIGMRRDFEHDFPHPKLPNNHRLSMHILYRINAK